MILRSSSVTRTATGLCLAAVALLEVRAMALGLRAHAQLRERTVARVDRAFLDSRARWSAAMAPGDPDALASGVRIAMEAVRSVRGEVLAEDGRRLFALPTDAPEPAAPTSAVLDAVLGGRPAMHEVSPDAPAVVSYARVATAQGRMLLRLTSDAAELRDDLRERREVFIGQGMVVLLTLVAGALLAMAPARGSEPVPPTALLAYEAAVDRLRSHGEELSHRHEDDRRRMEEQLQDREALARAGELTSGIVHEVRNGLATILGYARLLEQAVPEAEAAHARAIRDECESLEAVVRSFIDFIRRETLALSDIELATLLSRVVAHESRTRPGAEVTLSIPPGLTVRGDEGLLERAFENLVRNAYEAAGPFGHISAEATGSQGRVVIAVADDGPGMPAAFRASLRPFVTTKPGGLGLGLAIALKIVKLHGGELVLGDRPPHGLAVIVTLPAAGPA